MSRQFAGSSSDWASARTASAPPRNESKRTARPARWTGRGRMRTHASVMIPRIPSEPSSIRSGEGPAPEPGSRRDTQWPAGPTARTDSTRSSMWVRRVAKCPPARVAIQPPSVDSSNDCGKKRSVIPCAASCSSIRGPLAPAPMRAARETIVDLTDARRSPRGRS